LRLKDSTGASRRAVFSPVLGLSRAHPRAVRVAATALAVSMIFVAARFGTTQASPPPVDRPPISILPHVVGAGIPTTDSVSVSFAQPMDRASVEEALTVQPAANTVLLWAPDSRSLTLWPNPRWETDQRYLITVGASARTARGEPTGALQASSFTTETAPVVTSLHLQFPTDLQIERLRVAHGALQPKPPASGLPAAAGAVTDVSTRTSITIGFSTLMDHADVTSHFVITPAVDGSLDWDGGLLVFTPDAPLPDDARYGITLAGAHDIDGNRLEGDVSFSFSTRPGSQVVKVTPKSGATGVDGTPISVWFSGPMDVAATTHAVQLKDVTLNRVLDATVTFNDAGDQLTVTPAARLGKGHHFEVRITNQALDADQNPVSTVWGFTTKSPPRPTTPVSGPPPPADLAQYALWQINQARAAHGFAPLRLDSAISLVASGHALDMAKYGYFSHTGRDGSTVSVRLRRGGVSFGYSGENICYVNGSGSRQMIDWCHSVFMAEPYPGVANHIGNILGPDYTRVGFGIATNGSRMYMVWDFAG
jgi:uncharacterized protein YkwD